MLNKKVTIKGLLVASVASSIVTFAICYKAYKKSNLHAATVTSIPETVQSSGSSCELTAQRLQGFKLINPLLFADKTCESGNYKGLKIELQDAISRFKQNGILDNASVYIRVFGKGDFISINENAMFHPGSLIKLPILITYLKMEERNPGVLNKKLVFNLPKSGVPQQTYNSNQIVPGRTYSIKELLKYMIAYSDNNATFILNNNVDLDAFKKMFSDFGLVVPDVHDINYQISAKDYSAFLKVVYNSGYLKTEDSEFIAELLTECDFKDGIQSGLPNSIPLAHKFGEWGDRNNPEIHQLSESGIVYLDQTPYLLTIMTQGKDVKKLPDVLNAISKITYNNIKEVAVTF